MLTRYTALSQMLRRCSLSVSRCQESSSVEDEESELDRQVSDIASRLSAAAPHPRQKLAHEAAQRREYLKRKLGRSEFRNVVYTHGELDKSDLTKPPSPRNPHPFRPDALPPTHARALAPFVNSSPALQALVELGVDLFEVDTANPRLSNLLVRLDLERDVKPRLQWLVHELGFKAADLGEYLTRNPFLLIQNLDDMKTRVNYLDSKKFAPPQIAKVAGSMRARSVAQIIQECRYWINVDVLTMDKRLGWLQETFRLSGDDVRKLISKEPRLLQFGIAPLQRVANLLTKELGFSQQLARKMLLKDPRVFMVDPRWLVETFTYINRIMGLPHALIAEKPLILRCQLSSIRSRHEFLKKLNRAHYSSDTAAPQPNEAATILEAAETKDTSTIVPVTNLDDFLHPSDKHFANAAANTFVAVYNEFLRRH